MTPAVLDFHPGGRAVQVSSSPPTSTSCSTCRPRVTLSGLGVTPGAHSTTRGALKGEGGWGKDRGAQLVSAWACAGGQRSGVTSHQTLGTAGLPGVREFIDLILRVEEIQGKLEVGRVLQTILVSVLPTACVLPGSPPSSSSQGPLPWGPLGPLFH